jgi:rRNA-processing protein FCF1
VAAYRCRNSEGIGQGRIDRVVILDTNFLFVPFRFGIDIFEEFRRLIGGPVHCIVITPSINELELLREGAKPSLVKEINFAIGLISRCDVFEESLEPGETVDNSIIRVASKANYTVATNDTELRKRLREVGVPVFYLRQKRYLELDGVL